MRKVFYSFNYEADVMRVMEIRNMGVLEADKPVQANRWEEIKRSGETGIKKWIDATMKQCSCVVVLIGEHTYKRPWVKYEIMHAWNTGKGLLGIYIHDIHPVNEMLANYGIQGENPFSCFQLSQILVTPFLAETVRRLDSVVPVMLPNRKDAYNDIKNNISLWVEKAIEIREEYGSYDCQETSQEKIAHSIWGHM